MSTVGEIITSVQRQFGDDSEVQITRTDIVRWINQACVDIARRTDCIQAHVETSVTAGDGSYSLPANFLTVRKATFNGAPLRPTTMEIADKFWPGREQAPVQGTPQYFYIWAGVLYLYPAPVESGSGNLDIYYSKLPAALSADEHIPEIPVGYHEEIERYCLAKAKELDSDMDESLVLKKEYLDKVAEVRYEYQNPNSDSYPSVRLIPGDD